MITFVKDGVRITEEGWQGSFPRPDYNCTYSNISITFKDGPTVHLTEEFLRHALYMIEFQRNRDLKREPSELEQCLVALFKKD